MSVTASNIKYTVVARIVFVLRLPHGCVSVPHRLKPSPDHDKHHAIQASTTFV